MRVYQRCVCKKGSLVHYTFYQSGILENILTWSGTDECSQDQQSFWGGNTLPFLKDLYNEPSADICWEWSCFIFFQSGPKTLNSIQPVNFISDFWLRIEDIFPHTPPSSLNSLSGSSTVGQPSTMFFFHAGAAVFFWCSEKTTHKGGLFFSKVEGSKIWKFSVVWKSTLFTSFTQQHMFWGERKGDRYFKLKFWQFWTY